MRVALLAALTGAAAGNQLDAEANANPIRKVVTMLQAMQKKVESEGARDKELFDKFMCYCKTGSAGLEKSISDANVKVPSLQSDIEGAESKVSTLKEELKQAQMDRAAAKTAVAEATALRQKEAAAFAATSTELKTNIAAITKAVNAIDSGMAGGFLQTETAQVIKKIVTSSANLANADRDDLMAFFEQDSQYAPQSGEISGILKTMSDEMKADLKSATDDENASVQSHKDLLAAKKKEVQALTSQIEAKLGRVGELGIEIVQMKNDLSDSEEALIENTKFLADLNKDCSTKSDEYQAIVKTRQEELLALADTIKLLNDDDALELFKKTLPGGASLLQVDVAANQRSAALSLVKRAQNEALGVSPGLDFIAMAIKGQKTGFDKVIKLIDNMVSTLKKEQLDDDHKKEYCATQFDLSEDKKKGLEKSISDLETSIIEAKDSLTTLTGEIDTLEDGIKALDKQVAEQTEQRKEEHEDFNELMSSNAAAKELLSFAKNRLNKFYNPKLYKPPSAAAAFLQISRHSHTQPEAPEAPAAYEKKGEESGGVIAMIDALIRDLQKEITEAEMSEKDSQADYEQAMADSKEKRAEDSKALTDKKSTKAEMKTTLETSTEGKASAEKELMATESFISALHADCDFLLKYYDMRNEARGGEIDSLNKAKAILSGATFSGLQTSVRFLHK
jgi:septal ring factor EnvC (AmiA/AmiB activator)